MRLIAMRDEDFAWLLGEWAAPDDAPLLPAGGIAPPEVLTLLRGLAASVEPVVGGDVAWLMIADGQAVGLISLIKANDPRNPEIGYGVAPECQRRGHAPVAVAALLLLIRGRFDGAVAETGVDNRPSQAALLSNGFVIVGKRTDAEDGPLLCWSIGFAR